jgi:hypothetical protein
MIKYIFLTLLLMSGCTSKLPAPYIDITDRYELPPELKDSKIFLLGGGWSDRKPLFVLVPKNGLKQPIVEVGD